MDGTDRIQEASAVALDDGSVAASTSRGVRPLAMRIGVGAVLVAILGGVGLMGQRYWTTGRFAQTTDDAYVKADSTIVAPKVAGYIAALSVDDNQTVKAGQILAQIDPRDYHAALDQADANVAAAGAAIANLDAQITAQGSRIREADANVQSANASLDLSRRNDSRRAEMAKVGYGSQEQADDASTDVREKLAALTRLQASAATSRQQVDVLQTQRAVAEADLARAQAQRQQAQLNLGYSTIVAPVDGTVAARTIRTGQYVQAGTQLMALVPLQRVYVVANFKETQLTHVRPGQPARIRVDTFPGDDVHGRVDSLAPASGMEFSLLPPDNATGNFTKIVQRIPVKIAFSPNDPLLGRLRPGMSVNVSIDTKAAPVSASRPN